MALGPLPVKCALLSPVVEEEDTTELVEKASTAKRKTRAVSAGCWAGSGLMVETGKELWEKSLVNSGWQFGSWQLEPSTHEADPKAGGSSQRVCRDRSDIVN